MGRNPSLESSHLKTSRGLHKEYAHPNEHLRLSNLQPNQVPPSIPAGVAKTLKECNVQYEAFALAVWDDRGKLSSTHTSPDFNGDREVVFNPKYPRAVSQRMNRRNSTSKPDSIKYDNGEDHPLVGPFADDFDDFDDLRPFEEYGSNSTRAVEAQTTSTASDPRPQGSPPKDLCRPSKRCKPNARAYSAALRSESLQDNGSSGTELDEYEPLVIGDTPKVDVFYRSLFAELQQTTCKIVCKSWIRVVEPKKQTNYPYSKHKVPLQDAPPWWPKGIIHREPDHIRTHGRIEVLLAVLRVRENKSQNLKLSAADLKNSTETDSKIPSDKKEILNEILRVRAYEEGYENNEHDWDATISVKKPVAVKGYSKRSRYPSIRVKDETQGYLAIEPQTPDCSTDDSSVCSSPIEPERPQTSNTAQSPSAIHSSVSRTKVESDGLHRPIVNEPRSPDFINICNTSFHSPQDQAATAPTDEVYSDFTRYRPVADSLPAGQDGLALSLHSIPRNLAFVPWHQGTNIHNRHNSVATGASVYGSYYPPPMAAPYANHTQMSYTQRLTPLHANQQAPSAAQQPFQPSMSGNGCDTLSQSLSNQQAPSAAQQPFQPSMPGNGCDTHSQSLSNQPFDPEALYSAPALKSEEQPFQDPFRTETTNQYHGLPHTHVRYDLLDAPNVGKKHDRFY
ncbi:MAG: hypothetical protein M1836_002388 [Candelina mexicana]|nr:MAG: hypothetical protein M1836_002388 [Candelina mexicana]